MPTRTDRFGQRANTRAARISALLSETYWAAASQFPVSNDYTSDDISCQFSYLYQRGFLERRRNPQGRGYQYRIGVARNWLTDPFTFGVEIEFLFPATSARSMSEAMGIVAGALRLEGLDAHAEGYSHITRPHWKVVYDSSVRAQGYFGLEVVSPILLGDAGEAQVRQVCAALTAAGAKINVTCGLHVHIGMPRSSEMLQVEAVDDFYRLAEAHFDAIQPPSRHNGTFCRALSQAPRGSRYRKVNTNAFNRHRTVEFRQHSGTVEGDKVVHWVRLVRAVVTLLATHNFNARVSYTNPDSFDAFLALFNLPADTVAHFQTRRQKFARRQAAAA